MARFLFIFLFFVAGCAGAQVREWVGPIGGVYVSKPLIGGVYISEPLNFSVELPHGWMEQNTTKNHLFLTRDGPLLQYIIIERLHIDDTSLKNTQKKLREEMSPEEAAEVMIDNIASNHGVSNFEVIENSAIKISEFPGFRFVATYTYKDSMGQRRQKKAVYGFIAGEWLYYMEYDAAARHYFDKDIKPFEMVIDSFKLIKTE